MKWNFENSALCLHIILHIFIQRGTSVSHGIPVARHPGRPSRKKNAPSLPLLLSGNHRASNISPAAGSATTSENHVTPNARSRMLKKNLHHEHAVGGRGAEKSSPTLRLLCERRHMSFSQLIPERAPPDHPLAREVDEINT